MDLVEMFRSIPIGTKVTLMVENTFGQIIPVKATIAGEIEQHGFLSTTSGAWSLYGGPGWEPCYRVYVQPYRKKRIRALLIGFDIHDVEVGWRESG